MLPKVSFLGLAWESDNNTRNKQSAIIISPTCPWIERELAPRNAEKAVTQSETDFINKMGGKFLMSMLPHYVVPIHNR